MKESNYDASQNMNFEQNKVSTNEENNNTVDNENVEHEYESKNQEEIEKLDPRKPDELLSAFDLADNIVTKRFLSFLSDFEIMPKLNEENKVSSDEIRLIAIKKLVYDQHENNVQKLTNVYSAISAIDSDVAIIIDSNGKKVDMYIGILGTEALYENSRTLYGAIKANFPGSLGKYDNDVVEAKHTQRILNDVFRNDSAAIAAVSGVASIRNDQIDDNINNIQGIEKMIDSMQGYKYTAIFIANHLNDERLDDVKAEYELLYSKVAPFLKSEMSYNSSESDGVSESLGESLTETVGTSKSTSLSIGTNESTSRAEGTATTKTDTTGGSYTHTSGHSSTHGTSSNTTVNLGAVARPLINLAVAGIGTVFPPAGIAIKAAGGVINGVLDGVDKSSGTFDSISNSSSNSFSTNYSHSTARTKSVTDTTTFGKSKTDTTIDGTNDSTAKGKTKDQGKQHQEQSGRSLSITYENKTIAELLHRVDEQLERIKQCRSYGVFAAAAYFVADDIAVAQMAASVYKSLISGKSTAIEKSCINVWKDSESVNKISKYLKRLQHPIFYANDYFGLNVVTAASLVSGQELAVQMSFPKKSVTGVSVIESTSFGRNVFLVDDEKGGMNKTIHMGNVFHMGSEESTTVSLDVESLSMHTFITGSTGAGKSNTIYNMLNGLKNHGIKFMVVEPAKGEYKNVFGGRSDVDVYGTNPKITKMLKLNPFRFPSKTHVLEHIDRLVEIFNVCWPMYAAMPAVLKDAVEKAYEAAGWDLDTSINKYEIELYPCFKDVLEQLEKVVKESAFSQEVKDNYTGSLVTRVKSLTNGIYGRIFSGNEIGDDKLFRDRNVIVDLSRVGSSETKSMIMGILILRLQEYRMEDSESMNAPLKHVTVLEEAHTLLKRTSTEQSSESSNLLGKSVEMLSNIIAEVRTYGEGFIIADQSPGLLDLSVIRNTNTKIIMRIPEFSDRELVGKAANLNDSQIVEVARLKQGVAAIYQNNWLEPVLCKISKYTQESGFMFQCEENFFKESDKRDRIVKCLLSKIVRESQVEDINKIKEFVSEIEYNSLIKGKILKLLSDEPQDKLNDDIVEVVANIFESDNAFKEAQKYEDDIEKWNQALIRNIISPKLVDFPEYYQNVILQCIIIELSKKATQLEELAPKWVEFMRKSKDNGIL